MSATCGAGSLEAKAARPCSLGSEFWKVVDWHCFIGGASRVTGQKGVEGHIPQLAGKHPHNAERSSSKHLTLHQFVLKVEWLKLLSWERARLELKFVC